MNTPTLTRRHFVRNVTLGLAACAAGRAASAAKPARPSLPIGCLNRPWTKWSVDDMLQGVHAAGYRLLGLQTPTPADPFNGPGASREYLLSLKQKIAARGFAVNVGRLRTKDAAPFAEATAEIRQQVDNARTLGLTTLLHTGPSKQEHYEPWYRLMKYAAGYAADAGLQLVTKPHGGVNAAAAELVTCLEKIDHPNLGIWYDAGNIIHYTGKDPLQELEPIVSHVTAFTGKDCAAKGSEVMIQFGQGKVDFVALLRRLTRAGFKGPIMVESCAIGATAAETTANAAANRKFLEAALARV
jgi:sugar phosphate isomerase/epimerase